MATTEDEMASNPVRKLLHIGSGPKSKTNLPKEFSDVDETRLDIDEKVSPDVVADMRDLSMLEEEDFDVVYSAHNLEHLYSHEVVATLTQWRRVLKVGGFVEIRCSDLTAVCKAVVEQGLTKPLYESAAGPIAPIDILYGHADSIRGGNLLMANKTGFTKGTLATVLRLAGYSKARIAENAAGYELIARAIK